MAYPPHAAPPSYEPGPAQGPSSVQGPSFTRSKAIIVLVATACAFAGVASCFALGGVVLDEEVCSVLGEQAIVSEQLGEDLECSMDWTATGNDERVDYFHYEVEGSKGSGVAIVHTEPTGEDAHEELVDGILQVGSETFVLE